MISFDGLLRQASRRGPGANGGRALDGIGLHLREPVVRGAVPGQCASLVSPKADQDSPNFLTWERPGVPAVRFLVPSDPFTYAVDGDVVTFQRGNEQFVMRWKVTGNELQFIRDDTLGISPTPYVIKPYVRQH